MPESFYGNRTRERTNASVIGQYPTFGDLPNASGLALGTRAFVVAEGKFYDVETTGWTLATIGTAATGDMEKAAYDPNNDGRVAAADHATAADTAGSASSAAAVAGAPAADHYYGTDGAGAKGFHPLPASGGATTGGSKLNLYETGDGVWRHGATGLPAERDTAMITEWYSAGESQAVLPPRNLLTGMRSIDRYEHVGPAPRVLMITADPATPVASEDAWVTAIEEMGFEVQMVTPSQYTAPNPGDYAFIFLSYNIDTGTPLPTGLATLAVPIVCNYRPWVPDLGMATALSEVTVTGNSETLMDILDGAHEAAGDVDTGTITVFSPAGDLQAITNTALPAGAERIASLNAQAAQITMAAYPANIALVNGVAAVNAKRLFAGFFTKPQRFQTESERLFRSAAYWLAGFDY